MVSKETAKGRAQAVQARSDVRGGIGAKCGSLGGHGAPCDLPPHPGNEHLDSAGGVFVETALTVGLTGTSAPARAGDLITSVASAGGLVERAEPIEQIGKSLAGVDDWSKQSADPGYFGHVSRQLPGVDVEATRDLHTFVQFDGVVVVHDSRGVEQLTDRAALGNPLGDHGLSVMSIILDGDWFEITAMGRVLGSDVARSYRVPLTNVRSARR